VRNKIDKYTNYYASTTKGVIKAANKTCQFGKEIDNYTKYIVKYGNKIDKTTNKQGKYGNNSVRATN
jgi:uncharacterized coiled-coil DUF342 family protein